MLDVASADATTAVSGCFASSAPTFLLQETGTDPNSTDATPNLYFLNETLFTHKIPLYTKLFLLYSLIFQKIHSTLVTLLSNCNISVQYL